MLFARIFLLCLIATALLPAQSVDLLPDESLKGWTRIPIPPTDGLKPKLQWRVDSAEKTADLHGRRPARVAALRPGVRRLPSRSGLPLRAQGRRCQVQQRHRDPALAGGRIVDPGADRSHRRIPVRRQSGGGRVAALQSHEGDEREPHQAGGRVEPLRDPRAGRQGRALRERRRGQRDPRALPCARDTWGSKEKATRSRSAISN